MSGGEGARIWASFIKVKRLIEKPKKDSTNPHFKSKYANLEGVSDAINKAIIESGEPFDYSQRADCFEGYATVETTLVRVDTVKQDKLETFSMEKIVIPTRLPVPKTSPQDAGSGITYAKRYALMAIFGIVATDEDDDGNKAQAEAKAQAEKAQAEQAAKAKARAEAAKNEKQLEGPIYDSKNAKYKDWLCSALESMGVPDAFWAVVEAKMLGKPLNKVRAVADEVMAKGGA